MAAAKTKKKTEDLINARFTLTGNRIRDAAIGGLAATIRAWCRGLVPFGLSFESSGQVAGKLLSGEREIIVSVEERSITVHGSVSAAIAGSFCIADGLIWLPGTGVPDSDRAGLLAIQNGILGTFLQHNKKRGLGEKKTMVLEIDDQSVAFVYREVTWYAHQKVFTGKMSQDLVPGVTLGAVPISVGPKDEFLHRFLVVACPVFSIHCDDDRFHSCLVIPRVTDLKTFARRLHRLAAPGAFSFGAAGRFTAGAEQAALRLIADFKAEGLAEDLGDGDALAFTYGKVAWDRQQQNRSNVSRVGITSDQNRLFRKADELLGGTRVITPEKGDKLVFPQSDFPAFIAANLARDLFWLNRFERFQGFNVLRNHSKELFMLITELPTQEQALIQAIQKALRVSYAKAGERSRSEGADFGRLAEKARNEFLYVFDRCRGKQASASAITTLLAKHNVRVDKSIATVVFSEDWQNVLNLCRFAIISYASGDNEFGKSDHVDDSAEEQFCPPPENK
jgi:hypothetical protein